MSDHHRGFAHDLGVMHAALTRRRLLGYLGGAGALTLLGCATDDSGGSLVDAAPGADATGGTCTKVPQETAGPYPGDGTNGKNALVLDGVVRGDIRSSFAGATAVAAGVATTVTLTLVDSSTCAPLVGAAVYLWHCDRDGNYSMYAAAIANENYLRGVQVTDADGKVTFTTVFPGCYSGRWPHIHFEVYRSLAAATAGTNAIATSQLALPKSSCDAVYAAAGYEASVTNLSRITLASDNVFSDGVTQQLASISGSPAADLAAALTLAVTTTGA